MAPVGQTPIFSPHHNSITQGCHASSHILGRQKEQGDGIKKVQGRDKDKGEGERRWKGEGRGEQEMLRKSRGQRKWHWWGGGESVVHKPKGKSSRTSHWAELLRSGLKWEESVGDQKSWLQPLDGTETNGEDGEEKEERKMVCGKKHNQVKKEKNPHVGIRRDKEVTFGYFAQAHSKEIYQHKSRVYLKEDEGIP